MNQFLPSRESGSLVIAERDDHDDHAGPPSFLATMLDAPPSYMLATQDLVASLVRKIIPGTSEGEKCILEIGHYNGLCEWFLLKPERSDSLMFE